MQKLHTKGNIKKTFSPKNLTFFGSSLDFWPMVVHFCTLTSQCQSAAGSFRSCQCWRKEGAAPIILFDSWEQGSMAPRLTMQLLKQTAFEKVPSATCQSNTVCRYPSCKRFMCVLAFHNDFTAPCRCIMTSRIVLCPRLPPDLHVVAREQAEDF